jgi:hypothetical protein
MRGRGLASFRLSGRGSEANGDQAAAGDMNGDGTPDLLVSAPHHNNHE